MQNSSLSRSLLTVLLFSLLLGADLEARQLGYATATADDKVFIFDVGTNTLVKSVAVGSRPFQTAVSPSGSEAYTSNGQSGTISVIDVTSLSVVATINIGGAPRAITFHASEAPDSQHTDYLVADAVIDMMERHRAEPWFLGAGFYRPHVPWSVPGKYFDMYPMERIEAVPFGENEMKLAPEWAYFTKPAAAK